MSASGKRATADLLTRTTAHYDNHPFEFMTPQNERDIEAMQPAPFLRFINAYVRPEMRVAEIGCGPGRGTMFLVRRAKVTALDISNESLKLAYARAPGAAFVRGSALSLPFPDGDFDVVVCDGVIHHTPDAKRGFSELVRVLKPGGALYLGVYNRRRYYYYLYTYVGGVARWLERGTIGRAIVMSTLFPVYYLAHFVKSRGTRTVRGAKNFFYDYLITPRASFHRREEIESWLAEAGLQMKEYDPSLGNVHTFVAVKAKGAAR
jgi:ubiquinone/menaquinone biosynthesis C-methylase UbiE